MRLRRTDRGDRLPSDWGFFLMALVFKVRDWRQPRRIILQEVGIKTGDWVLDFGCGPGSYIPGLAELVGPGGKVFALDAHPRAVAAVRKLTARRYPGVVTTIFSDCATGLSPNSLDAVLMYDVLHDLGDAGLVLEEVRRVLKPGGILSLTDHHLKESEIVACVTSAGGFCPAGRGNWTINFKKKE